MDAKASRRAVRPHRLLVDIGLVKTVLCGVPEALDDRNLDDPPELSGVNTTTEQMASHIQTKPAAACRDGALRAGGRSAD